MEKNQHEIIGKVTPRKDGVARVTGQEKYPSDISLPRMLYGRVVASPYAHALIKRVDVSKAEAMGAICLTYNDIPKARYNERVITVPWALHKDKYVLADKVRRMGEAVVAVAAETEELAEKAARAVVVEYEVLPVVTDPHEALKPDAPQLYETVMYGDTEIKIENNIALARDITEGDAEKAFAEADIIVEGHFKTPRIYHAQMETKTAVVQPDGNGGLTVWATVQSIHNTRIVLGQIFDIPLSKINVKRMPVGGTFGSSIQMNTVVPICAALAIKARRPVKMSLTREEDMHDHARYPIDLHLKLAAKKDGTLLGADADLVVDIGAHVIQGYSYLGVCIGWLVSLYRLPNVRYKGKCVYTNKAPSCAMQGYGNPQMTFAAETLMDELAEKLGVDPIEMRLKNYVGRGDTFWGQGPLVKSIVQSDGVPDLMKWGAEKIDWKRRKAAGTEAGRYKRGIAVARGFHTSSAGAPRPGDVIDYSGAMVKVNEDGSVDVVSAVFDHGGGTLEAMAKLVAEKLCLPLDKVNVAPAETCSTVYDVCTHATRGVYAGCGAAVRVAEKVRTELIEAAARYMNMYPEALTLKFDSEKQQGLIYCPTMPEKYMTIKDVAQRCWTDSWKTIAVVESYRPTNCPPPFVCVFLDVEVDTYTGIVRTVKAAMGGDCGTIINPDMVKGQLEGGLSRGAGYALSEQNDWDSNGQLISKGFWIDAKTPGIEESCLVDDLDIHFVETFEPTGPYGAKGIGEAATNPVAAAYANAIYNATGVRFMNYPLLQKKFWRP